MKNKCWTGFAVTTLIKRLDIENRYSGIKQTKRKLTIGIISVQDVTKRNRCSKNTNINICPWPNAFGDM